MQLPRALSSKNLKGWQWHSLLGCLTHDEKVFPYIQSEPLVSIYPCCFLSSLHAHWTTWLHHLDNLPVGTGRLLLGPPGSHLLCRLNKPGSLSLSSESKCSSPQTSWWLSAALTAVYWCLYWGPKTEYSIVAAIPQALREQCWLLCSLLPGKAPVAASQLQPGHVFTV